MKKYNAAPLPFQGQKRNFINKFRETLDEFPENAIYVDLFGGSGILSHTIKAKYPNAKVVYNDFDNYSKRLQNVDKTNELIDEIREIVKEIPNKFRIPTEIKKRILEVVKQKDYVDYITLSSNILFSGNYANDLDELEKATFYNRTTKKVYDITDYLNGVNVVSKDYRDLYDEYKNMDNVVFVLDPPYLSTDVKSYNKAEFWKLTDYLNVLKLLENKNFFYFTSNKGQLLELCEWLEFEYGYSPFKGCTTTTTTTNRVSHNAGYTDVMLYKLTEGH